MGVSGVGPGNVRDMERMDEKYLIAAFERAKAHQKRALAALGHPTSSREKPQTAATGEDRDASDRRVASPGGCVAPETRAAPPASIESSGGLRESAARGVQ